MALRAYTSVVALFTLTIIGCATPQPADTVFYGKTWTGDSTKPMAAAVAVRGDSLVAVGDSTAIARLVGPKTTVIAAGGGLIVPGFMDDHVHFFEGGQHVGSVLLRDAASPAEFVRRIKTYAATLKPGEWILGGDWDHEMWAGTPLPDRSWIDSVTPANPVALNRLDGHMILANSLALKAAGLSRGTAAIPGGEIVRRPNGELTGVLKDEAQNPVYARIPPATAEQLDSLFSKTMTYVLQRGVTGISAVSIAWPEVAAFRRAHDHGNLLLRASLYVPLGDWRRMADTLKARGPGDEWLRVAGVKGLVDGSLGSTTALFFQPFSDAPNTSGLFVTPEDSLRRWIAGADSAGLQVVVHAIGDRANALLLDVFDSLAKLRGPRDRRFRIEHAQHLRREDIPRFAALGVIASMQPYHAVDDGRWAEKRIGPERIKTTYAFRSLIDAKAHLAFGSDWFVAPIDPLLGLKAAVTRQTADGRNPGGWVPEQKVTLAEALRSYTAENAYGMFAEMRVGKLIPGFKADLVLLDRDLFSIPAETIDQAKVRLTMVGGKAVYRAGN